MKRPSSGTPLRRRLVVSYLLAFGSVLGLLAVAVHVAFVVNAARQTDQRLASLAQAAAAAVEPNGARFDVSEGVSRLLNAGEGLIWYANDGRPIAVRGTVPRSRQPAHPASPGRGRALDGEVAFETLAVAFPGGSTRAFRSDEVLEAELRTLDLGLLSGVFFGLLASVAGAWLLTAQSVRSIEDSMQRLREFTADAAHELRSPLAAIVNNADATLRDEAASKETYRRRLETIHAAGRQMRRIADDLLVLARADRQEPLDTVLVDLAERVRIVEHNYRSEAAHKQIALTVRLAAEARTYGDPEQVDRIIGNLVSNAVRYTLAGGAVTIEVGAPGNLATVSVSDTGSGIAPTDLDRIFDRFWRADATRRSQDGAGLGLAIARALAERHRARIDVESRLGSGSTFTVRFPAASAG